MIMKANKQIGFIYKNEESIDKILKDGDVVFERGFLREKTSTTLPITFGGVGKDLKDYKIYGNTYQNSTSGKNLFDISNVTSVDNGSISDNLITSDTITQSVVQNIRPRFSTPFPFKVGTYYISADIRRKSGAGELNKINDGYVDYTKINFPNLTDEFQRYVVSHQYNADTSYADGRLLFQVASNSNQLVLEIKNIMISTSNDYDFEPYTGGQPSPSPEFNQKMVSCGDRTKNLFDKANATYKDGYLKDDVGAERTTNQSGYLTSYVSVKPNTTYTIQGSLKQTNQSTHVYALYYYDINKNWIYRTTTTDNPPYTFTTPNDCYFIQFQYRQDAYDEDTIQIEENSTATSYEPYYEGYKIPVNVRSDNLFDKDDINIEDNKYLISDGSYSDNSNFKTTDYIPVKSSTIYNLSPYRNYSAYECFYDENKTFISSIQIKNINNTFTTPSNAKYIRLSVRKTDNDGLILVEGSATPTKYQPYYNETTNIYLDEPLRKIDGYSDYIDFINGKVVRNIEEIVLDGNENWFINGSGTDRWFYYVDNLTKNTPSDNGKYIISSHYIGNAIYSSNTNKGIVATKSSKELRIRYGVEDTIANFKTWLSSNNVTVDYVLVTPTEEDIELPNIPTIDGNNTLNIETEITPSQVYIKYKSNE